jgi:hypothetical protein
MVMSWILGVGCLLAPAQDKGLAGRQEQFLKAVMGGKVKEAYGTLLAGSPVLEKTSEVENLVTQTEKGLQIYGGASAVEDFGLLREDKHVATGAGLLCCEKHPLFFYFVWYRPRVDAPWRIQTVWFDDNVRAFMEQRRK